MCAYVIYVCICAHVCVWAFVCMWVYIEVYLCDIRVLLITFDEKINN